MIGKTISHYKILEKLGEGGMGVVYKAQDTKLDRIVALKFLPKHLLCDEESKQRFANEAKAASALDHPNIATIYEIDEVEDECFISMAYIEGQNLKQRIELTPLKIDEAIGIAIQVADGLQEAHQKGIIHRDIKSANIMLTPKGQAKIMDFGLAKLAGQTRLTKTGATMGTFAYMSPEQAKGDKADHRADIWSLGVVIYEMITGQLPFKSEYEQAIVYSILNEEPEPMTGLRTGVPMELEQIVAKSLEKKKDDRYQHIEEMLVDLRRLRRDTDKVLPKTPQKLQLPKDRERKKTQRKRLIYGTLAAVLIILAAISIFFNKFIKKEIPKQILTTHKQITFTGRVSLPSISPDGKFVAYVSEISSTEKKVLVQELTGGQPLEVFTAKEVWDLCWSPDGSEILIPARNDRISGSYIVPRLGGTSRRMMDLPFISWDPDGSRLAGGLVQLKRIWFMNKSTGDTTSISLNGFFTWLLDINWSPTGNWLLFYTKGEKEFTIWTIKTDGTQQYKIVEDSVRLRSPRWSSKGDAIYYLRSQGQTADLMKIKIDLKTGKAKGVPIAIQSGLQAGDVFSLSRDNKQLLYTRTQSYSNLWLVAYDIKGGDKTIKTEQLTTGTSLVSSPRISPDGKKVVFSKKNLFIMAIERGQMKQITFLDSYVNSPVWSPDGKEIAFGSPKNGVWKVWRVSADGGTPRVFDRSELSADAVVVAWSPGSDILYQRPGNRNYHFLNPKTEEEQPLVENDSVGWMFYPKYSPDGKRVAVNWNRKIPRSPGLWIISVEDSSQIFTNSMNFAPIQWSSNGNWIYAWDENAQSPEILMISASNGEARKFITLPFENIGSIDIYPNGKKIVCTVGETQSDAWLMENFDPEVK
jgi:serine/threonine protein kinase